MNTDRTASSKTGDAEMAEPDYSSVYCEAAKQVVERHFIDSTFSKAFQELKAIETILETIEKCGVSTLDGVLQSVRIAGSVAAYRCKG